MKKRLIALVLATAMCTTLATGCSLLESKPKNAAELLQKSQEVMSEVNYHMDMKMALDILMDVSAEEEGMSMGMKIDMPVEMKASGDFVDKYAHMDVNVEGEMEFAMEFAGESESQKEELDESMETYIVTSDEHVAVYTKEKDGDWEIENKVVDEYVEPSTFINNEDIAKIFEEVEMKELESGYKVEIPFEELLKIDEVKDAAKESFEETSQVDFDDFAKALEDVKVVYEFNEDCYLTKLAVDEIKLDLSELMKEETEDLDNAVVEMSFGFEMNFDKFGEIKVDAVKVPKDVVDNAKAKTEDSDDDAPMFGFDGNDEELIPEESATKEEDDTAANLSEDDAVSVSGNWNDYAFNINGKELRLPCSYEELKAATGYEMKSSHAKSFLEGESYINVNLYDKEENLMLYVDILNETKEDLQYTNCKVISVWQTDSQVEYGAKPITFPGGLKVGQEMTKEKLEELFGKPQDTYEDKEDPEWAYEKYTYCEDPDWSTRNTYEFTIVNGIITEIALDHTNF